MEYSIDWGTEIWATLRWMGIVFAITLVGFLVVGFVLARFTMWGKQFWRVSGRFFLGPQTRTVAWGYLIGLMLLSLFGVRLSVLLTYFSNDLYTSLQIVGQGLTGQGPEGEAMLEAGKSGFWHSMAVFGILAAIHVGRTLLEIYVGSAFEIKWRWWLTENATADWMGGRAFYRNRFVDIGDRRKVSDIHPGIDNPDQRIESDITNLASSSRVLVFSSGGSSTGGVIPAIVTIVSFTKILWDLSGPMTLGGIEIPRMMVWLVFMYVLIATAVAFWIGP